VKVLVTGAGGFIGSHLVEDRRARGDSVVALDLEPGHLSPLLEDRGLSFVRTDVARVDAWRDALAGVEIVFHLASVHLEVGVPEERFREVNVRALRPILAACRDAGVRRFVHCSSVGVYGDVERGPADETSPCRPTNLYEETKLAGEREVLAFHRETGFPVTVIRPAWVFGPRCRRTERILRAVRRGRFLMIGEGSNQRHPVFISDMVEAFHLAAERPGAVGQVFVIGAERAVTLRQFVETVCDVTGGRYPRARIPLWAGRILAASVERACVWAGRRPPISTRTLAFFTNNNAFDISKAKSALGFRPKYDLRSGLCETLRRTSLS
jgi:nucleoside-diphosphate-sugar epimerase